MEWYYLFSESKWKNIITVFIYVLLTPILLTIVHEFGHVLIAYIFGWTIIGFQVAITYFRFGQVIVSLPIDTPTWQLILFECAGTYLTFFIGILFLFWMYHYKSHPSAELFLYIFGFIYSLEMIVYILLDVFVLKMGDWMDLYILSSGFVLFTLILAILYLLVLSSYFYKLMEHLDIEY